MNKPLFKTLSLITILALMLMALPMQGAQAAPPTELFFSEYIEGTSFNKAVEIYNGTGTAVDLSTYTVELYSNGAASPSQSVTLSGTLADGDVFVLAHASADAAILAVTDLTNSSVINFNGDDAVVLRNTGAVVDAFGQIGVDPGSEWPGGGVDDTLRRAATVCAGDTNASDAFNASVEWVTFAVNTFDGLGAHTANCGAGDVAPAVSSTTPANTATNIPVNTDINVTFSEDVNASASSFGISCSTSGAHTAAVSSGPTTFTLDPDADFANGETCTVTVFAAQVTDQDSNDPPDDMASDYAFSFSTIGVVEPPDVIITEIMYDPNSAEDDWEWIEIYNAGSSAVDLTGFVVDDNNGVAHSGANIASGTLAAGEQAVLYNVDDISTADFQAAWGNVNLIPVTNWSALALNNTGDQVSLWDSFAAYSGDHQTHANAFDTVNSTGAGFPDPVGASIYLTNLSADNNVGSNWATSTDGGVTPLFTGYASSAAGGNVGGEIGSPGIPVVSAEMTINEFSASTAGTDVEYVEIFGTPSTDFSAFTILEIEGDSESNEGTVDEVISLGTTDAGGFYLVSLPANALENGTITLLLVSNFTGALNNDLDTNDDGTVDVTPWNTVVDAVAVNDGGAGDLTYGVPSLGPNYDGLSSFAPGGASRIPDGLDTDSATDWARNDFDLYGIPGFTGTQLIGEAVNTPGVSNELITIVIPPFGVCGAPATPIHDVQGNGPASPLTGLVAIIEGVVVSNFQGPNQIGGYHIQEEDAQADDDSLTSEGIYIFDNANTPAVGDVVRVEGIVTEFSGLTEISGAIDFANCSSGNPLPATTALYLPVTALSDFEAFEGMRVIFPQALVISEYFNYERFGEMVLALPLDGETRPFTGTAIDEPGAPALARAAANSLRRITLDDGLGVQNPAFVRHPNGDAFALDVGHRFRGGDTVENAVGVLDYAFGLYRIQPTGPADYTAVNTRPDEPEDVGGRLRIAAMNTLNFFITQDYPTDDPLDNKCGPSQNVECRGADSDQSLEFTRQRDKLLAALAGLDADVIGLNELENTLGVEPLGDPTNGIVAGLNALPGADPYAYIDTGVIGTDAIRVGLIYRPSKVVPVGDYKILDSTVDPRFIDTKSRPALAQTFEEVATGERFTVVVNHLKSKGSACDDVGDPDAGDGQGNCNLTRKAAAEALVDWLATDPTGSDDPDFIIMGDLNSYAQEDPIDAIKAGSDDTAGTGDDYTNLIFQYQGTYAYSYVFDGQSGYLDHALANPTLTAQVTGAADWHINSDEPDLLDYDTTFKPDEQDAIYEPNGYRSSDHDPVIIGLNLVPQCNGQNATVYVDHNSIVVGGPLDGQVYNGLLGGTNGDDVIVGTEGSDTILALNGNDVVCSLGGSDAVFGGAGNDTIDGGAGNDAIFGGLNNDVIEAGAGNDTAFGEAGNDTINGGNHKDSLFGGDGSDVLDGGADKDVLEGGLGVDTLAGGSENDTVLGGPGNDALDGGAGNDICNGGTGTDTDAACEIRILLP